MAKLRKLSLLVLLSLLAVTLGLTVYAAAPAGPPGGGGIDGPTAQISCGGWQDVGCCTLAKTKWRRRCCLNPADCWYETMCAYPCYGGG